MAPALSGGIDHVHVYVRDRAAAARWYGEILGFVPVPGTEAWAADENGPLTLQDAGGKAHIALFRAPGRTTHTVAFGATAAEFLAFRDHLAARDVACRIKDHDLAFSLYFDDPDGNGLEITTYEVAAVRGERGRAD